MPHVKLTQPDYAPTNSEKVITRKKRVMGEVDSFQATAASGVEDFPLKVDANGLASLSFQAGAAAAAGETLVVDVSRVRGGVVTSLLSATYTYDNGESANTEVSLDSLIDESIGLADGDLIRVTRTYTAGGGPTPVVNSLVRAQFG